MAISFDEAFVEAEREHRPSMFWGKTDSASNLARIVEMLKQATEELKRSNDEAENGTN